MRLQTARVLAAFSALTWWLFPGFGVVDLGVTWDPDWPVVLEATWGVFMTVLVGGAFAAVAAAGGVVPWLVHAADVLADNRRGTGVLIGDVTMGVDHHAVQGALALALPALALLAALWPRGRRHLGVSVGLCAGYVGLVSYAFPGTLGGFAPAWSVLAIAWAGVVATLAVWPRQVPSTTPVPAASTRTPSPAT